MSRHIVNAVKKPVFADADTGYGNVINVARTVREFEKAGVAAISIEDQISPKRCPAAAVTPVVSIPDAVARIKAAVDAWQDPDFLIQAQQCSPTTARIRSSHEYMNYFQVVQVFVRMPTGG